MSWCRLVDLNLLEQVKESGNGQLVLDHCGIHIKKVDLLFFYRAFSGAHLLHIRHVSSKDKGIG